MYLPFFILIIVILVYRYLSNLIPFPIFVLSGNNGTYINTCIVIKVNLSKLSFNFSICWPIWLFPVVNKYENKHPPSPLT